MNTIRTSNIPLRTFRDFLISMGCKKVNNGTKGRGGHEKWVKEGALRPITLQTHIDPVPLQVVALDPIPQNSLRPNSIPKKKYSEYDPFLMVVTQKRCL